MRRISLKLEDNSTIYIHSDNPEKYVYAILSLEGDGVGTIAEDKDIDREVSVSKPKIMTKKVKLPESDWKPVTPTWQPFRKGRRHKVHRYHGGTQDIQEYITNEKDNIVKDIMNPNLTLGTTGKRYLISTTVLYKYFKDDIMRRYKVYPFLGRSNSRYNLNKIGGN